MAKLNWRIYYGDGTTFDDSMGSPFEAPSINVQVIVGYDRDNGRQMLHFWDWYYYRNDDIGEWWGADIHGLLDQLLHDKKGEIIAVKQGRTLGNNAYQEIVKRAQADPDFLPQSAKTKLERPSQVYGEGHK